ncbi:MAG: DNA polymerase III subunit alpha [Deltaproteobacteria bacterium]|nr:DNA polymerase III subunit alpha [Deltaproteobacteria bacterium]
MHHSKFVHLHLHTQYSLLDGAIRPHELIALAREYKMPAVAVTDHGNLFGAVEFYKLAMAGGVKPIFGCETYVAPGARTDKTPPSRGGSAEAAYHLVLLVKNAKGYQNLCRLLTKAYLEGFYYRPRIDKGLLMEHGEGLIALSACLHGEVSHYIGTGQRDAAMKAAKEYKEIFPDRRFYLELQMNGMEEQNKVNRGLIEIGRALDIPLVATNDCHYLRKADSRIHDILLCIQTGTTVNAPDRMRFPTDEFYFKSPEEMDAAFRDVPEAISNTIEIAERCNFEFSLGSSHLPDFPVPAGETLETVLENKAKEGLERRLKSMGAGGEPLRWQYYERLNKELKVIKGVGFSGYFLIVNDFIEYAKGKGIPVGPGRGSAAGSLAAYSLGITNLDPIRYNLLFERFLNPDRISLPDIDVDFCFERRDEVIRYVTEKYGSDNVGQIITFGVLKARACIRDVGRALDMPYGEVDRIAKLIPAQLNITIESAVEQEPKIKALINESPRVKELIEAAKALEGLPRHASTHAAGVVISNRPLVDYLPLYKGQKDNIVTTQFSMKDVEKIGLVKFDFLGLKTLTVIQNAIALIKKNRGDVLDIDDLPQGDAETYSLVASGSTNGIFQLESTGMKELLRKLRPETFEDLIAACALYRPGPLQSGMVDDFINRKQKKTAMQYEVPELKGILENTYGVIVYQEQVMEIAKVLAGFTPGEADILRKAMGKKLGDEMLIQRNKFLEGSKKKNIPVKKAEKIFDLMAKFALYGFNKSHSAAYALIAYQTAYLKAHYAVEYMAALLTSGTGDTDEVVKYINDCRDMGITVLPPHINESSKDFTVSLDSIRFALAAVKNVGDAAIDEVILQREKGPFQSIVDFLSRVDTRKVNKKVVESLIKCGAFDSTGVPRANLFSSLASLAETAGVVQRDRDIGQQSLFGPGAAADAPALTYAHTVREGAALNWSERETLLYEKEALGFYFSSHPLSGYRKELESYSTTAISSLKESDAAEVTVAGIAVDLREILTKKGERMAFVRIEDTTGSIEAVVFSDLYKKVRDLLSSDTPVIVTGRLERDEDEAKLIAAEIIGIDDVKKAEKKIRARSAHITVNAMALNIEKLEGLKKIISENPGPSQVLLTILYPDGARVVLGLPDSLKLTPSPKAFACIKKIIEGAELKTI